MKSYVKVSPEHLMEMVNKKRKVVLKEREDAIEKFLKMNIKPERTFLFFFKRKAVTREDLLKNLESDLIDDFGHNYGPYVNMVASEARANKNKVERFAELAETAKHSEDKMIRLSVDDNIFLNS